MLRLRVVRFAVAFAFALALLIPLAGSHAFEPGTDPARAGMCDDFDGLAFTFCVALCEARECDRQPVDDERCAILQRGFDRASDGRPAPCSQTAWQRPLAPL